LIIYSCYEFLIVSKVGIKNNIGEIFVIMLTVIAIAGLHVAPHNKVVAKLDSKNRDNAPPPLNRRGYLLTKRI
jgi:hypothetical protein